MLQDDKSEVERLRIQVRRLAEQVEVMSLELQHLRNMERLEREKLRLQIENELLRGLPAKDDK